MVKRKVKEDAVMDGTKLDVMTEYLMNWKQVMKVWRDQSKATRLKKRQKEILREIKLAKSFADEFSELSLF